MDQERNINTLSTLIFIWSFVIAVFVSSFFFIQPLISIFIILVGAATLVAGKESLFISIALISFGLGILRYDIKDFHEEIVPTNIGIVIGEPEQRENTTRFVMRSDNGEKVLVNTDLYSEVAYGDRVEIKGKLQNPGIIDDGIGRPFDYAKYLSRDDIYFVMNFAEVSIFSSGHGNRIKHALFSIKRSIVSRMRGIFTEPQSSLLSGLILAGKGALPKGILEEFRRAGIIHIVVLSGYNITIIAEFMRKFFGEIFIRTRLNLSQKFPAMASILGIILFVLMTGAEATVVRAAIMVLVVITAKTFNRAYSAPRALLAAAFFMILHNPKILVFDPSFQLSFIATCALIYVVPIVEKCLNWITEKWGARMMVATTLATQITVLPFLVYSMGEVSLVSLPANLLVLLFIPYVMFAGFIATLVAYASSIVALPLSYFSHLILSWILWVAHFLGNLSFATITTPLISFWFIVLIYLAMIIIVQRLRNFLHTSANLN